MRLTVEAALILAGFALVAVLVVSWFEIATGGKAANSAACIASRSTATCSSDTYGVSGAVSNTVSSQKGTRF